MNKELLKRIMELPKIKSKYNSQNMETKFRKYKISAIFVGLFHSKIKRVFFQKIWQATQPIKKQFVKLSNM